MHNSIFPVVFGAIAAAALIPWEIARGDEAGSEEFFEKRVRPVLVDRCFRCHGGQKVSGGLRVDSRESLVRGGDSGPAFEADSPDSSLLLKAIRRDDDVSAMPPDKPLAENELADLAAWIRAGARWPARGAKFESAPHWAFQPVHVSEFPKVTRRDWLSTPVDPFVLAPIESAGSQPAPTADRRTLLRRLTYDLTGLPPTPEAMDEFAASRAPDAYDRALDRLLASPHYGEHWGRHWLDVVRYADTAGENSDHPLPHAWRYRNWVLDAFNRDLPYNEFLRDQISGDLRPPTAGETAADQIVATGYLAIARRFGHDIDKDIHLTLEDTIDTLGKSVLGLSLGCCRCHDHKYDPLSMRDYYGLYGIFASTRFSFPGCEPKQQPRDLIPIALEHELAVSRKIDEQIAQIDIQLRQLSDSQTQQARAYREAASQATRVLAQGQIDDGTAAPLAPAFPGALERLSIRRGEVLQLQITPRGNHGADSTLVDFEISELQGGQRRWSLNDLVDDLPAGNPHSDRHGHGKVWCFLDLQGDPRFLAERLMQIDGRGELRAWRNGDTPSVFVNTAEQPVKVWTELPPRQFFVHPGQNGPVAIAWVSPIDGDIAIRGRVGDAHPAGDGVGWVLEHFSSPEVGARLLSLGDQLTPLVAAREQRAKLEATRPAVPVAFAVTEGTAGNARMHRRGEPADPGDEVPRKFLDVLGGQQVTRPDASGRFELGEWLTDAANPLTPRVIANRVWQWHFGRGLVSTPNDFGTRGAAPTHPELLDYLAASLIRADWSLKRLHRQLLLSSTYQQVSRGSEPSPSYDGFMRRRLTAEELRDTLLVVSGEWDPTLGHAHPFPQESTWSFSQHGPFAAEYETSKRSVYVMQKRNRRIPFFALFDGPDPNASTPLRDVTTVPTQALFFLNDPLVHTSANRLAARLLAAPVHDDRQRLDLAYRWLFGRPLTESEWEDGAAFLGTMQADSGDSASPSSQTARETAWQAYARVLLASNELLHLD